MGSNPSKPVVAAKQQALEALKRGGVTITDAAANAGISRPTLYAYPPFREWKSETGTPLQNSIACQIIANLLGPTPDKGRAEKYLLSHGWGYADNGWKPK